MSGRWAFGVFRVAILLSSFSCASSRVGLQDAPSSGSEPVMEEPDEVEQELRNAADSTDLLIRGRALDVLIATDERAGAGNWGPRGIWDPDPGIQGRTIRRLALRLPEPESRDLLRQLAGRESAQARVRCSALSLLEPEEGVDFRPWLSAQFGADSTGNARLACGVAAMAMEIEGASDAVSLALREDDLPFDIGFVRGLESFLGPDQASAIAHALEWAEEGMGIHLAAMAARLDLDVGWRYLTRALNSEDAMAAIEAFEVLVELSDEPRAHDVLTSVRGDSSVVERSARIYRSLREGRTNDLARIVEESDRSQRELAVFLAAEALSWETTGRAQRYCRDLLTTSLSDEDWPVRRMGIRGLAEHADSDQMRRLIDMMATTENIERLEVAIAIRYRMASRNSDPGLHEPDGEESSNG